MKLVVKVKVSFVAAAILAGLYGTVTQAVELDLSFIRGGEQNTSQLVQGLGGKYISGRYLVDITLNEKDAGRRIITISESDTEVLCLSEQWLSEVGSEVGVVIRPDFYQLFFDAQRQCYQLELEPNTKVDFEFSTQQFSLSIPQRGLQQKHEQAQEWDYGTSALRLSYNANVNANEVDVFMYSSIGIKVNVGKWVASSSLSITEDNVDLPLLTASRALYDLKADLTLGRTFTSNSLVGGVSLVGVGLVSNSSMSPSDLGYAPAFTGIAKTNARVSLVQGGVTIYSELMPPGPFEISGVNLLSSGDVTMVIKENNGEISRQFFPLTILPNMLTPGEMEYSVQVGVRDDKSKLPGIFVAGSYGYGFEAVTLRGNSLLHANYMATGLALVRGLGTFGTIGMEGVYSFAQYQDGLIRNGGRLSLTYGKTFGQGTDLQLVSAQYISEEFVEFSGFNPSETEFFGTQQKNQYELSISHHLNTEINLGLSAYRRAFWNDEDVNIGLSGKISGRFDFLSLSLGADYSKTGDEDTYNVSLSASIPFSTFDKTVATFAGVTVSDTGSENYTAGVSSSIGKRVDYSASTSWSNSVGESTYSLQSSYRGDRVMLNGRISQSGGNVTGSASVSGAVIVLPKQNDWILTRNISDTIAIANVKDTPGVEFDSSPYPSNDKGNAVIPLRSYRSNKITLSGSTLPLNLELLTTSQDVLPTASSVVLLPFEAVEVKRYLFQIKDKQGRFVQNGTWATSASGLPLGFIAQNGVLFVNSVVSLSGLILGDCQISASKIKETIELQEVTCD
ncbi:PefC/AfrB family outer membrane usher protein [Vibrio panuliri]|uniref:PapC N-terminal domain-containing protein n=1 Tax=Vibrio panuliri TaxID=1381081 RepID=A0ABX3F8H2_9VIBR|nr:PefC/AfrB family outer membrane usher protein [Vibrio panuliri]KAB1457260.1 PefC/AfrB family outer membrane usher protein [Vibrio panuliri]OLQ84741.1 hypothetical protein BIY20_17135 [Vibrio panuliri]